jgi:acyl transferase domain-containing protein/acyl carrier protein
MEVAIIGMAGRFPAADNIEEFWGTLRDGKESISFFSEPEMERAGIDPDIFRKPDYVPAGAVLEGIDLFDAQFFGYSARESELIDPQQRLFLECAWQAMENAGYATENYNGVVGVYAGAAMSRYLRNIYSNPELVGSAGVFQIGLANDKDFLATRVSYKLNLEGPSVTVQTACSTSLVAVHLACQSLLTGECDIALAGGVRAGEESGYRFHTGGIASPDGHCRPFDASARGTVPGNGLGVVVLRRLEDALRDGDEIRAIIKGTAINNDGASKIGYTAPRIEGQAAAIRAAMLAADTEPETIGYIEAHGTATELGDPIEVAALVRAFRSRTSKKRFCALGSVKSNIGHLDAAAGIAGLMKAVLALQHKMIPPSLHFTEPNPNIDLLDSPFYVNASLSEWKTDGPRRAGVSSFGMGGTNAHVVLEEAPCPAPGPPGRPWQLLPLSAKTPEALESMTSNLSAYLENHHSVNLGDVAHTLQVGRKRFPHRRMLVSKDVAHALAILNERDGRMATNVSEAGDRSVVFLFSGLGDQYVNMARGIYEEEPVFRQHLAYCSEVLKPLLGTDIRDVLFEGLRPAENKHAGDPSGPNLRQMVRPSLPCQNPGHQRLTETFLAQPALFALEYALAQLWMAWGIHPKAMIGYSIGEYVAACLAGVFSLEDVLLLVSRRAQLIHQLPRGAMLATSLSEEELLPFLGHELSLAAVNGPSLSVVAGPVEAIAALQKTLMVRSIASRPLQTTHAFHSAMLAPLGRSMRALFEKIELRPPRIPYISNVTGNWAGEEVLDPDYWVRHTCEPVRFADGIGKLWKETDAMLLEVGPGQSLSSLAILHPDSRHSVDRIALASLPNSLDQQTDTAFLLTTFGKLWLGGARMDWNAFRSDERHRRIPLPTYPFDRQRFWIERQSSIATRQDVKPALKRTSVDEWLYVPFWKPAELASTPAETFVGQALLFIGKDQIGVELSRQLRESGWKVVTVETGPSFAACSESDYQLNPENQEDYNALIEQLLLHGRVPELIVHSWNLAPAVSTPESDEALATSQYLGFYSFLYLAQALGKRSITKGIRLYAVSSQIHDVTGREELCPEKMTLLAPLKTIPQEYLHIKCCNVDIDFEARETSTEIVDRLHREIVSESGDTVVAFRRNRRWTQDFEPVRWGAGQTRKPKWREGGVYLIVGGLGHIGLAVAEHLAESLKARLVLVGRSCFPPRAEWQQWVSDHDETEETASKIRRLLHLEELGAQVAVLQADVAEEAEMRSVVSETLGRFGELHGVVHTAGVVGKQSFCSIQETSEAEYERHAQPKMRGLMVLQKVLDGHQLDFCLLFSSLTSVLGGLGFTAYTAANLFMDAWALRHARFDATPWISLNSDAWRFDAAVRDSEFAGLGLGELAMTPEEGMQVVRRVLSLGGVNQVVVSTAPLRHRISKWIKLDSLQPTTGSNKTKGLSLHQRPNLQSPFVAARNDTERKLVELWEELLGVGPISTHDNFFEMGGHSLLIVQMTSRLRELFRTEIPMKAFFETPTIAGLARQIETSSGLGATDTIPAFKKARRDGPVPLSFAQQRLWLIDQMKPGSSVHNLENPVLLTGRLHVLALEQTMGEIHRRHEVLRSAFPILNGTPVQVSTPAKHLQLPLVDLSALLEADRQSAARQLAQNEAKRPFALAQGPLLRIMVLRLGSELHLVLFTMHHIISDAWSIDILIREIAKLYRLFKTGESSTLSELAVQYADFAQWQREWLEAAEMKSQLSYWKNQLAGCPDSLPLPADHPRPRTQSFKGASYSFEFPPPLVDALRRLAAQHRVTLFMNLLAAFLAVLHRYTGEDEIVVGSPVANRRHPEVEPLIGLFVNPLVLRVNLSGNPSFKDVLARVREVTLQAQAHQDLPFEVLVEALQPHRTTTYTPFFQVVFAVDHLPAGRETILEGLHLADFPIETDTCPVDIHLAITDSEGAIDGLFTYDCALFNHSTIVELARAFVAFLTVVSAAPERAILEIPLRPAEESNISTPTPSQDRFAIVEGQFLS